MSNEELVALIQIDQDREKHLEELYLNNIGIISEVAWKYSAYAEYEDLMQEAFIGILKAVELWRHDVGAKFVTYAYNWMCSTIQRYISDCGSSIRVPDKQRFLIIKYERTLQKALLDNPKGLSDKELSAYLRIDEGKVKQLKKDAQMLKLKSLDEPITNEDESLTIGDSVADNRNDIATIEEAINNEELADELWSIVDELEPLQAKTIRARYQDNLSYSKVAERLGETNDTIRYAESKAFRQLRRPHNKKKLQPFLSDDSIYSISVGCSGYGSFRATWTSAPERVALINELRNNRKEQLQELDSN